MSTTLKLDVDVDATRLLRDLPNAEKRIAFSVQAGLNRTIGRMREGVVARVASRFTVRDRTRNFLIGSPGRPGGIVARTTLASVAGGRAFAEIFIGETSKGGPFLVPRFEEGGTKRPTTPGAKALFTPITGTARGGGFGRSVDPQLTFAGMKLKAYQGGKRLRRRTRRGLTDVGLLGEFGRVQTPLTGVQWKGQDRTFLLPHTRRAPLGAAFQRFGPRRDDIRTIWKGIAPWTIPSDLGWKSTAEAIAQRWAKDDIESEVSAALLRVRSS